MQFKELPVWAKLRMLINQKIQNNIIDPSVFIDSIDADKAHNGFNWKEAKESFQFWEDIILGSKSLDIEDPKCSELYIYESTPREYGLKMSHSDTYLYFTKQQLYDLGLTNPIVELKGSRKYHTFEEHLNNKEEDIPIFKEVREGMKPDHINLECHAFKEWAKKQKSPNIHLSTLFEYFIYKVKLFLGKNYNEKNWMDECTLANITGKQIVIAFVPHDFREFWSTKYDEFILQKKSPVQIFIEWAKNTKRPAHPDESYWEQIVKDLQARTTIKTEEKVITFLSGCTNLNKIVDHIYAKVKFGSTWYDIINKSWQTYLKTINHESQLQRKEVPVTGSTAGPRPGIHLGGDRIEPSRGYRCNQKGCEIFGETIAVSKARLSFGHN